MGLGSFIAGLFQAFDVYRPSDQILAHDAAQRTIVEDISRAQEMARNRAAYNGVFVDPLLHDPADTMDTVRVNKIRPIIDISVSFLFDSHLEVEIPKEEDGEDSPTDSEQEKWLEECLEAADWPIFLINSATNGAICGTPYVKFIPPDEARGEKYPKLWVLDPACMSIQWDPRDISHITQYTWQYDTWKKDDDGKPIAIVVRQRSIEQEDATWLIIDEWAAKSSNFGSDDKLEWHEDGREVWPYKWSPVLHCQNLPSPNEVYGDPDLDATVIESNDRINFIYSNWARIYKHHAHKIIYIQGNRGAAAELIKLGPKAIWDIPDPQANVGSLSPDIDGSQGLMLVDEISEEMWERTQTPGSALGQSPQGRDVDRSGVTLRFEMGPLIRKTNVKRLTYGAWVKTICNRLLEMGGYPGMKVKLTWNEMLPIDPVSQRQVALMDVQLQVPYASVQEDIGHDYAVTHPQYLKEQKEIQDLALAAQQVGPNGQPAGAQMTPAGSQVKGAGASKNDTGPSLQKKQSPGMRGTPANNSKS